jgi:IrrE N-terminal-like domain
LLHVAGLHSNRGAKRAREARVALGLDPRAPLTCLLTVVEERCPVVVSSLPEGIAGACTDGLLWVNGDEFVARQRFTLAHEFGHAWIGHSRTAVDTDATLGLTSDPLEIEANAFAGEFLVPKAGLLARVHGEPTLEDVVRVAVDYGVSTPMMLVRFKQNKIGSEAQLARLQREVDANEHGPLFDWLGLQPLEDRLSSVGRLPYLSPPLRRSLLDAVVHGDAAASPELARALERLMRPGLP